MRFDQRIEVQRPLADVWEFLWDIERLARCLPSCKDVREVEPQQRYTVVMEERVGPFKARFEMDVRVAELVPERLVRLEARGMDKKLGASTRVEMEVKLEETPGDGTALLIGADVLVMGKIAGLGHSVINRKVQETMKAFGEAIAAQIESSPTS